MGVDLWKYSWVVVEKFILRWWTMLCHVKHLINSVDIVYEWMNYCIYFLLYFNFFCSCIGTLLQMCCDKFLTLLEICDTFTNVCNLHYTTLPLDIRSAFQIVQMVFRSKTTCTHLSRRSLWLLLQWLKMSNTKFICLYFEKYICFHFTKYM